MKMTSVNRGSVLVADRKDLEQELEGTVKAMSIPRHAMFDPRDNRNAAELILGWSDQMGYKAEPFGQTHSIFMYPQGCRGATIPCAACHYDSVPGSPGANDNASAIAAIFAAANRLIDEDVAAGFIFFNREEDGLLGSREFIDILTENESVPFDPYPLHVLDCVGYTSGTQVIPQGFPGRDTLKKGDFLTLISDFNSGPMADEIVAVAEECVRDLHLESIHIVLPFIHKLIPHLDRSDHWPFWVSGREAVFWTDTAEFRNPNYHEETDTPDTLDYSFLAAVTELLTEVLRRA